MITNPSNSIPHDVIVQRAFDFHALGLPRQAALAVGNKALTPNWFTKFMADTEAAVKLPTYGQLQASNAQVTADRNAYLKEARPLLLNLFHYAGLAYPGDNDPSQYFSHDLYTQAGSNAGRLLKALQAAVAALATIREGTTTRRDDVEEAGMPEAQLNRLEDLAELAQGKTTRRHVVAGETSVTTSHSGDEFTALWLKCVLVAEAAVVAYRTDDTQRRLFLLHPGGPEERVLTIPASVDGIPALRALTFNSMLSADRRLSLTIEGAELPVTVELTGEAAVPLPGQKTQLGTSKLHKPHRCKASSLGWMQPSDKQLIVSSPNPGKVVLRVRVLPLGE